MEYAQTRIDPREWDTYYWDFEIQTDHLILARQPDLLIVNKKENLPQSENQRKHKEKQVLEPC